MLGGEVGTPAALREVVEWMVGCSVVGEDDGEGVCGSEEEVRR